MNTPKPLSINGPRGLSALRGGKAAPAKFADPSSDDPGQRTLASHGYRKVHGNNDHSVYHHPRLGYAVYEHQTGDAHFHHAGSGQMEAHRHIEGAGSGQLDRHITALKRDMA